MKIIIGDSWAVGEWDKNCNLSGPGFGQLMMLHDIVANLSLGAASNTMSLDRLERFFDRYQPSTQDDDVYWVVTCPSRDRDTSWFLQQPTLYESIRWLLDRSLSRACELAEKYRVRIHLIGGLCDLDTVDTGNYTQLDFQVPSWGSLLDKGYYRSLHMPTDPAKFGSEIKKSRPDLVPEWLEMAEEILQKTKRWEAMSRSFFKTDGHHPDRDGHKVLRDHLWPEWADKF